MSLLDLRRRIKSVKGTQKITKAMQLVAASKMKRAQDAALKSRPYADELQALIDALVRTGGSTRHPFFRESGVVKKVAYVVFTGDRGLCGAFNSNAIRQVMRSALPAGAGKALIAVGRRGGLYFKRFVPSQLVAEFDNLADHPKFLDTVGIARILIEGFLKGDWDEVRLVYTKFVSTMQQDLVEVPLLPLKKPAGGEVVTSTYTFEPSPEEVLARMLPRALEVQIWQALLESNASEQSARMVAMKNATDNARELTKDLTLEMNKTRQAMITREISEIVAGVESMAA